MELRLIILSFLLTVRSYGAFLQCSYDFFPIQKLKKLHSGRLRNSLVEFLLTGRSYGAPPYHFVFSINRTLLRSFSHKLTSKFKVFLYLNFQ